MIYNPWEDPPETGSLAGEFAGPQLDPELGTVDEESGLPEMEAGGDAGENMAQALNVIQQQSTLIGQLLMKINGG